MAVGELVSYANIPWDKMHGRADPLEVVLLHGLRAYVKFDSSRYVARTKSLAAAISDKLRHLQRGYAAFGIRQRVTELPRELAAVWDSDITLLALDRSSILEILATGDCTVAIFEHGGLKPVNAGKAIGLREPDASGEPAMLYEEVGFAECFLVDKWRMLGSGSEPDFSGHEPTLDEQAVRISISRDSLYFEKLKVERAGREKSAYPPQDGKERPQAMIWLYEASVAYNRGLIVSLDRDGSTHKADDYKKIERWLDENAGRDVAKGALKRVARTLAPQSYNRSKYFSEDRLAEIPGSGLVPKDCLSLPVRHALALTEWWINGSKGPRRSIYELACMLEEAGFEKGAVKDLVGMISGKPVSREDETKFRETVNKLLKGRAKRRLKKPESVLKLRKGGGTAVDSGADHG